MPPDVRQQLLDRLFQATTSVELADWVLSGDKRTIERRVQLRWSETEDLLQLASFLRIQHRGNASLTFGFGDYLLIFEPSGQRLTIQHAQYGLTLGAELLWRYDAPLADGPGLAQYLRDRGFPGFYTEGVLSELFPPDPGLADWESPPDPPVDGVLSSLEHLQQTIPDPVEMAESLLIWSGTTNGTWDRYPGGRAHMRKMLQRLPTKVLIKAIKNPETQNGARILASEWTEMPSQLRRLIRP